MPKSWRGGRVLLHFGAVDWESTVWINGREAGTHRGGYDPFTYDITEALKRGAKQEVVLRVYDPTDEANKGIARGKQVMKPHGIFYTAVTGIWQTVWLEPVPETHISGLTITPDIDRGTLTVLPAVAGDPGGATTTVTVKLEGTTVASAQGPASQPVAVAIDRPELWSPDNPVLYDLEIALQKKGRPVDAVTGYAGMRKIALGKDRQGYNRLFLNGEPLFQIGPLDQGWWPDGLYTAPTDAALRYDLETIKSLGLNMLRKHVKVEPDRLYYWCDRLGLLVWQDMPSALFKRDAQTPESLAGRDAQFEGEWKAVMDALRNHPSIVMWVPFNEGWGQYDTERIAAWTKSYDPTRLVNNASGWTDKGVGDTVDIHSYPGPDMPPLEENRAAVLGEFGGLGLPLTGHLWQPEGNWGYRNFDDTGAYEARYADLIKNLYPLVDRGLAAAVYTQTSDCEIEVNGLLTYDRAVLKLDPGRFAGLNRGFTPPRFLTDQTRFAGDYFIVELAARPGATIRYTVDGTEPVPESALYDKPIEITGPTTVKARAFWPDGTASLVESRTFERAEPIAATAAGPGRQGPGLRIFRGDVRPAAGLRRPDRGPRRDRVEARRRRRGRQGEVRPEVPGLHPGPPARRLRLLPQFRRRLEARGRRPGGRGDRRRPRHDGRGRGDRSRGGLARDRDRLLPEHGRPRPGPPVGRARHQEGPGAGLVVRPLISGAGRYFARPPLAAQSASVCHSEIIVTPSARAAARKRSRSAALVSGQGQRFPVRRASSLKASQRTRTT